MKDTIRELWYGNIDPIGPCGVNDSEMKKLFHLMERNREKLSAQLSEAQAEILQKYIVCSDEYTFIYATNAFEEGFSLACKLMAEAYTA